MVNKVLIISPVPLFPVYSGNRKRIYAICRSLMQMGYSIDFFYTGFEKTLSDEHKNFINGRVLEHSVNRNHGLLKELKIRLNEIWNGLFMRADFIKRVIFDGFDSGRYNHSLHEYKSVRKVLLLQKQLSLSKSDYSAVIVNYAVFTHYFSLFDSEVVKIVDAHDKLTDRYKIFLSKGGKPSTWFSLRYTDEMRALRRADILWAITDEEEEYYRGMLSDTEMNIMTLGHIQPFQKAVKLCGSKTILMVGSDNQLNISGFYWFYERVWKTIRNSLPGVRILVAGSICKKLPDFAKEDGIVLYGSYNTEDEIFTKADLCINPMQEGTGLKIKTVEALSFGKPVLSALSGAAGLSAFRDKGLICSDDPDFWKKTLTEIMMDDEKLKALVISLEEQVKVYYQKNLKAISHSLPHKEDGDHN
ncbi:MAG: glycosyltransferase [Balneolaceae bacterium]|nr:MAG: glycosyltransferase [Balneolaceae bacterium]